MFYPDGSRRRSILIREPNKKIFRFPVMSQRRIILSVVLFSFLGLISSFWFPNDTENELLPIQEDINFIEYSDSENIFQEKFLLDSPEPPTTFKAAKNPNLLFSNRSGINVKFKLQCLLYMNFKSQCSFIICFRTFFRGILPS